MDVTALCSRLLMAVLAAACVDCAYLAHRADAAFPRVSPDRLQFFEYEAFSVSCEEFGGSAEWRVMWRINKRTTTNDWNSSAPSRSIYPTFIRHSGEYWCEDSGGQTSGAINLSVTAGSVILEVPASPVMKGHDVILQCRSKESKHIADFYKDGVHLDTQYNGIMNIQNVSKSDEGLYKCTISGTGESPESWLNVQSVRGNLSQAADEATPPSHSPSPDRLFLLWVVGGGVMAALVLLVMGVILYSKLKVSRVDNAVDSHHATYAVVRKSRNKKVSASDAVDPDNVTYAVVENTTKKKNKSRAATKPPFPDDSLIYSKITLSSLAPV